MSFGFGVGDFIAVIELANNLRKDFSDAPSQFRDISAEVRSLSIVLQDVEVDLSERELNDQQRSELKEIATNCRTVLDQLQKTLEKYGELKANPESFGRRIKRVWKRLKWEPEDIRELRNRISTNVSLLNAFNEGVMRDNMVKLVRHQDDQERRAILDWLCPIDYAAQQSDFISRRQAGTGQWLLDSAEFQEWLMTSKQTLFCPGIPGAGKTILTSTVIERLDMRFQNDRSIGIAYLYCNFRRHHEQKLEDLLASLLKQLVQEQPSIPDGIKILYERHKDKRTRPSLDEIVKDLHSAAAIYSRVFIVVDALDECQISDGCRTRFLSEIFDLQAKRGASLFATSRPIPELTEKFEFEGAKSLEIRASDEDVQRYLNGHLSELPSFVSRNPDLQKEIAAKIIKAVDGMFLLAQLHLGSLIGKRSPKAIRTTLEELPTGSKAYDHAYEEAMQRIESQVPDSRELAKQVLSWITCAKRPLTTLELQHALAIEIGASELDKDNIPQIENMVSVCAGLVTVDEESNIIRLVHYTTQEYFERMWTSHFPNAEVDITRTCVTYLLFDVFGSGNCDTDDEFETRLETNPLYDYAAHHWGHHALSSPMEERLILDLLESQSKVSACAQALIARKHYSYDNGYSQRVPRQMTGVHLAAYFGLENIIMIFIQNGYDLDSKDTWGQTPLFLAAGNGHESVVKLLLEKGADLESKNEYYQTPLSQAARNGYKSVVELLLEKGAYLESADENGRTPLSRAVRKGDESVVKLLLEKGADLNFKDEDDDTPLSVAVEYRHESVVKLLLERGADLESKNGCNETPLSQVARLGHESLVKLLLEKGADLKSKSQTGPTPLSQAAWYGHESVVKLLLEKGADPEADNDGVMTLLEWTAIAGHDAIVKLLQQHINLSP